MRSLRSTGVVEVSVQSVALGECAGVLAWRPHPVRSFWGGGGRAKCVTRDGERRRAAEQLSPGVLDSDYAGKPARWCGFLSVCGEDWFGVEGAIWLRK